MNQDSPRPRRLDGVEVKRRSSSPVLLGGPETLALNDTALAIWDLCDGETSVDEMVGAIVDLTGIPETQASADVDRTLAALEAAGVLRAAPEGPA